MKSGWRGRGSPRAADAGAAEPLTATARTRRRRRRSPSCATWSAASTRPSWTPGLDAALATLAAAARCRSSCARDDHRPPRRPRSRRWPTSAPPNCSPTSPSTAAPRARGSTSRHRAGRLRAARRATTAAAGRASGPGSGLAGLADRVAHRGRAARDRQPGRRPDAWSRVELPARAPEGTAPMRIVIAEDSRDPARRPRPAARRPRPRGGRRGRRRATALRDRGRRAPPGRRGRRHPDAARRTPTRGCAPRSRSAATTPTSACWCSRSTSRPATPPSCSPARPRGVGYLLKDRVADVDDFIDALEPGGRRRHRARPRGRRPAARRHAGRRRARRAHPARARGARR